MLIKQRRLSNTFSYFVLLAGFGLISPSIAIGQNHAQKSLYMVDQASVNPALAGVDEAINLSFIHRSQWVGIDGNPKSQFLSASLPLSNLSGGAGISIINDLAGAERNTFISLSYAYRLEMKKSRLTGGIGVGFVQKALDGTKLIAPQGDYSGDNGFTHNDNFIPETKTSGIAPDISLGVFYKHRNLYAGISATHLTGSSVKLNTTGASSKIKIYRTMHATIGYEWQVSKKVGIAPSVYVKSDFVKTQIDFSGIFSYKGNIWLGASFRGYERTSMDAVAAIFGFKLTHNFKVNYAYDISISNLGPYNSGSHELGLSYRIKMKDRSQPGKIIYNPRFL